MKISFAKATLAIAHDEIAEMPLQDPHLFVPVRAASGPPWAIEEERKRISRELHDGVVQELHAVVMHLRIALAAGSSKLPCNSTTTALAIAERGLAMTRSLLEDLHRHPTPPPSSSRNLADALRNSLLEATRYSSIQICLETGSGISISEATYAEVASMAREIATNTLRHAAATRITCSATRHDMDVGCEVEICDDGIGFDAGPAGHGRGIRGLHERARQIGGLLWIESSAGKGTVVRMWLPTV